jgi:N-acetylglucosaminyldiphosphoundecaprenol N-acetyl-beta-D-mannosaminyltransferase
LLQLAADEGYSIYLLGARQDVLEQCVGVIRKRHPSIKIAGYRNGYFKPGEFGTIIKTVNTAKPDLLFLGMGSPMKERFAFENRENLRVPIVQGVGGSFDVIAGIVKRAPLWMQRWGIEWLFRVIQEPRRMFWRYLTTNSIFLWLLARRSVAMRLGHKEVAP